MFDVVTIGSATQDIFIESDLGKILDLRDPLSSYSMLCFEYGAKIEIDQLAYDIGGGAVNSAVNFTNLGFKSAPIVKLGNDLNAKAIFNRLEEKNIDKSLVLETDKFKTGFSVILTSFEGDRTVLAHRGANSRLTLDEIPWENIKNSKWIYIAPLSGESNLVLDKVAEFAENNGVFMAFNPGTTQIKRGLEDLRKVIYTAEVLVMNKSEAASITGIAETCIESKDSEDFTKKSCSQDINEMLYKLKSYGPKVVVITEGSKGVHCFDGNKKYFAPPFPSKVLSTLGAGDAFASTFVGGLIKYDWNIEKSIKIASVNAAQIIQNFGAQSGLKNFNELEEILNKNKDYKISIR
ncbi:MAG: carbohydrate kinase family protein [Candidatus Gastranaerophilales bacterium]|nr:carbohydrate kinase family protein [Candidatus Gastranaerophilales bacterium]